MSGEEFKERLKELESEFKELFSQEAGRIAGNVAVSLFKKNFQNEGFFGEGWKEVKRREDARNFREITRGSRKGEKVARNAWGRRKILTGTGDLGRSIEYKITGEGEITVMTAPDAFSREPYGRVHNEGLRAGRGKGFIMPKRQFIGDDPELRKAIIRKLEEKLEELS
jgi:phage gpG-like protein